MKITSSIAMIALALSVSANIHAAGGGDTHHHGGNESQKLQLNAGKKWATDEVLRQTMDGINQAMAKALPKIHQNEFSNEQYQALAATVSQKLAYAVEHCKLEPKSDAMLHLVIAELMAGTETMEGKTSNSRHDGAVQVLMSLKTYGKYFQHPGWKVAKI